RAQEVRLGHGIRGLKEGIAEVAKLLEGISPNEVAGIASPAGALEDNFLLKKLFEKKFNVKNLAAPFWGKEGEADDILKLADKMPNRQGLKLLGIDTE